MTNLGLCRRALCAAALSALLLGCPFGFDASSGDDARLDAGEPTDLGRADTWMDLVSGSDTSYPEVPALTTLCMLQLHTTSYDAAKQLLGPPESESQDAQSAGLAYRFRPAKMGGAAAAGAAGGGAAEHDWISILLRFDYQPGFTVLFPGPGPQPSASYVLGEISVTGMPYADCWREKQLVPVLPP